MRYFTATVLVFMFTLPLVGQQSTVLFQSDGSSLAPFFCDASNVELSPPFINALDGVAPPSIEFSTTNGVQVAFAPYVLPSLEPGQILRGTIDVKAVAPSRVPVLASFGVAIDPVGCSFPQVRRPIPEFLYVFDGTLAGNLQILLTKEGGDITTPINTPLNFTDGIWHNLAVTVEANSDGSQDYALTIDGLTVAQGSAYANIGLNESLGVMIGAASSGGPTNIRYDNIKVEIIDNSGCPDLSSIDYQGFTATSCAVPQNAVSVFNQTELDAYMSDFGFDGTKVKNVKVNFNPTGDVTIISPCEVKLNGLNNFLDINADKVCVYGRKSVAVAEDSNNPDRGITAGAIALVSEEGDAGFFKGLELIAEEVMVQAEGEAKIGIDNVVDVEGAVALISTGDTPGSNAIIKQNSRVVAKDVLLISSRGATIGNSVVVNATGDTVLESTGLAVKSVAEISQGAQVTTGTLTQTSGNKAKIGQDTSITVTNEYHMNADGSCTIASSASISTGSTSGNCFP